MGVQIIYRLIVCVQIFYKKKAILKICQLNPLDIDSNKLFLVSVRFTHLKADWELSVVISSRVVTVVVPDLLYN